MAVEADLFRALKINRSHAAPSSKRGWMVLAAVVVAMPLLVAVVLASVAKAQLVEVRAEEAVALGNGIDSRSVLDATGYVVARRMATVSAKITGKVSQVLIEEGQHVAAGQVMATLDPIDAEAQRDLAATQVAVAHGMIGSVRAQLKEAESNALRLEGLVQQHLVSRAQYDQVIAQRDALRAQFATAQRYTQVADRQLRIADHGVDNTIVRAPFGGVVVAKAAQPGEIVSPLSAGSGFTRTGIGTIVDMDSLEIEVDVGEAYIGRVRAGMPVEAILNAYPEWTIPAEVIAIIPAADRAKATVQVRIALKQKDRRIVPDMGVKVSFLDAAPPAEAAQRSLGVRVPAKAIIKRDGVEVAFVFIGNDGKGTVEQRTLKSGSADGDGRQVLGGLAAGDSVIIDPPAQLEDGTRVRIASAD